MVHLSGWTSEIKKIYNKSRTEILMDHRNDVKIFKTQVETQATDEWFHCKVLNISMSPLFLNESGKLQFLFVFQ